MQWRENSTTIAQSTICGLYTVSVAYIFCAVCRILLFCFLFAFWSGWSYCNGIPQMQQQKLKAKSGARIYSKTTLSVFEMKTMNFGPWNGHIVFGLEFCVSVYVRAWMALWWGVANVLWMNSTSFCFLFSSCGYCRFYVISVQIQ